MIIRVHLMGRSYDAAAELPEQLSFEAAPTLAEVLQLIADRLSSAAALPSSCLVIVNGQHLGTVGDHEPVTLADQDEVSLIAPVAGG